MKKSSIIISCHRASELMEKSKISGLSFGERMLLRVHKIICGPCQSYKKQSDLIDECLEKQVEKHQYLETQEKDQMIENISNLN